MNCYLKHWNAREAKKDGKPLTLVDRIIMLRSDLTHTEWQFSERYGGVSWSFTLADGAKGCRFKMIKYNHPKRWVTDEIPLTDEEEDKIWVEACRLADLSVCTRSTVQYLALINEIVQGPLHARYDLPGILTHATKKANTRWLTVLRWGLWWWTKFIKPDPEKMWCSESAAHLEQLVYDDMGPKPDTLDPDELHKLNCKYFAKRIVQKRVGDKD